jgi:hypothetical protein
MTIPDRQADLAELITRYGQTCADVITQCYSGDMKSIHAADARCAELVEEFTRRGLAVRSPL